jgi:hypothetical protein
VHRVDEAVRTALTDPVLRARIEVDGTVVLGMPAARFAEFYQVEYRKWGEAVRISKAVVD